MGDISELEKLVELYKAGAITEKEFALLKIEVLSGSNEKPKGSKNANLELKELSGKESKSSLISKIVSWKPIAILLLLACVITFLFLHEDKYSKEIKKTCLECKLEEIAKSDYILVTNKEGKSNVFSKTNMSFILSQWYEAEYDNGMFFDDITFSINGGKVICVEDDYKQLSDDYINNKINNNSSNAQTSSNNTCAVCGRQFVGNGYEEVSDGVWKQCREPYQCPICSKQCGMKHTAKMNGYINGNTRSSNTNSDYNIGNDGRLYENNSCSLCKGTGIETSHSSLMGDQARVCPMCSGKGVRSY